MSVITNHERPGVYSSYEASSITSAKAGGKAVAVVAAMEDADGRECYTWYSDAQAAADCGQGEKVTELSRLACMAADVSRATVWHRSSAVPSSSPRQMTA